MRTYWKRTAPNGVTLIRCRAPIDSTYFIKD
jgi:hypothetical protein